VLVIPASHFYIKSIVFAADRTPYAHNPTGFVPQFHGDPISVSEIGYSPGRRASAVRAQDNVEADCGGLFGAHGRSKPTVALGFPRKMSAEIAPDHRKSSEATLD